MVTTMERNYVKGTWNILIINVNLNTVSIASETQRWSFTPVFITKNKGYEGINGCKDNIQQKYRVWRNE